MAERGGRWTGRWHALWLPGALVALAATPAPAAAQARPVPSDSGLVTALVVSSAVLRQQYERRAAEDQFALLQDLAQAQDDLKKARNDAKAARKDQLDAEGALAKVEERIAQVYDEQAKRDATFAAEQAAMREQIERVVAEASPAKRAALERYARGDRTGAYAEIKALTQIENDARRRAADLASARNLKGLLALANEQLLRGEGSIDEVYSLIEQINALDPADIEIAGRLITKLGHLDRFAEAVELVDRTKPFVKDSWAKMDLEVAALGFRLKVQPVRSAVAPLQQAAFEVEKDDRSQWSGAQLASYCGAVEALGGVDGISRLLSKATVDSALGWCIEALPKSPENLFSAISLVSHLGVARADERDGIKLRAGVEGLESALVGDWWKDVPGIRATVAFKVAMLGMRLAEIEGRQKDAKRAAGIMAENLDAIMAFTSSGPLREQFLQDRQKFEGIFLFVSGDIAGAMASLEPQITKIPEIPSDLRSDIPAWVARGDLLLAYEKAALASGDIAKARSALDRMVPIMTALQWAHPLDQPLLARETHGRVYRQYMEWVTAAADLRLAEGKLDEAETRLQEALTGLEPYSTDVLLELQYPVFRQTVAMKMADASALKGDLPLARQRYRAVIEGARAQGLKEPGAWFPWVPLQAEARLRLAQIDSDMMEIARIRAELAAYAKDGREPNPFEPWVRDVREWKAGKPIHWQYGQGAIGEKGK